MASVNNQDPSASGGSHHMQPHYNPPPLQAQRSQSQSPANPQNQKSHSNPTFTYPDSGSHDQSASIDFNPYVADAASAYNANWDPSQVGPSQAQPNGFAPQQNHGVWNSQHQAVQNPLSVASHGYMSNDYTSPFAQANNAYGFQNYHFANQYQGYPGLPYNQHVNLGAGQIYNGAAYPQTNGQSLQEQAGEEQTVSPSALQNYPNAFSIPPAEGQSPKPSQNAAIAPKGPPVPQEPPARQYDDELTMAIANSQPAGVTSGKFLTKDLVETIKATNSKKLSNLVVIGKEVLDLEDPKTPRRCNNIIDRVDLADNTPEVTLPRIPPRLSLREIKAKVLESQGDRPWTAAQRPLLKRLKMKPKSLKPAGQESSDSSSEPSSDEDSSGDESGSDAEPAEPAPVLITQPRPAGDPARAVTWDVVKTVWSLRRMRVSGAAIRAALGRYWELWKPLREAWRAEITAVTAAEAKAQKATAEQHRGRANERRKLLDSALRATIDHGHPDIVENLSENPNLVVSFYQLIADRFKENDVNGPTVTGVLSALFEKAKLDKVLPKLLKRGNESTKSLVQSVLDHTTGKVSATKSAAKEASAPQSNTSNVSSGLASSVRRGVDSGLSKTSLGQVAGDRQNSTSKEPLTTRAGTGAKADGKAPDSTGATGLSVAKAVDPKSVYAGLQSASKKSKLGGPTAGQKAPPKLSENKKPAGSSENARPSESVGPQEAEPAAAKPSFSFADAMASLSKPKEPEPAPPRAEAARPNETPAERQKRLRKEARHHLRVRWKPDSALVETRHFTHDPAEELDMDHDAVRADLRNEGRMLKRGLAGASVDEEEAEEERAQGAELMPWRAPVPTDFAELRALEDAQANLASRGGTQEPQSAEREVQRLREMGTLVAIYPTRADLPDTPREPADPFSGPSATEMAFGEPPEHIKAREAEYQRQQALQQQHMQQMYAQQNYAQPNYAPANADQTPNIAALLQVLNAGQQQQAQLPPQAPMQQAQQPSAGGGLEAIFSQFRNAAAPAPVPQAQPALDPTILQALKVFNQQQQQAQTQPPYQPPPPAAPPQQAVPDLSNLLARITQNQVPQQQGMYGYQDPQQQQQQQSDSRKRPWNDGGGNQHYEQNNDYKRGKGFQGKKFTGHPYLPCRFYQEGKCKKGKDCTFLHE